MTRIRAIVGGSLSPPPPPPPPLPWHHPVPVHRTGEMSVGGLGGLGRCILPCSSRKRQSLRAGAGKLPEWSARCTGAPVMNAPSLEHMLNRAATQCWEAVMTGMRRAWEGGPTPHLPPPSNSRRLSSRPYVRGPCWHCCVIHGCRKPCWSRTLLQ